VGGRGSAFRALFSGGHCDVFCLSNSGGDVREGNTWANMPESTYIVELTLETCVCWSNLYDRPDAEWTTLHECCAFRCVPAGSAQHGLQRGHYVFSLFVPLSVPCRRRLANWGVALAVGCPYTSHASRRPMAWWP